APQITGTGRAAPGAGGGRSHLCAAARTRGASSLAQTDGSLESGDPHRQLCESRFPRSARGLDRGRAGSHRTAAPGEADDRLAYRPAGASDAGGISAARLFLETPGKDAQGLRVAPERFG